MTDERGQALILTVFILAIAAVAISGLRAGQDRLLAAARERRAGEAAVAAAAAVLADAYVTELREAAGASPARPPRVAPAVTGPRAREAARVAASRLSVENGGAPVASVAVRCERGGVEVAMVVRGTGYRAGFEAPECSQP